jgi:Fic family protein
VADWDANSTQLQQNLQELGSKLAADAAARAPLSSEAVRTWQALIMRGLTPTDDEPFGVFRGEPGLEDYNVRVGPHLGSPAPAVSAELAAFNRTLAENIAELDGVIRRNHLDQDLTADTVNAVIILCAWAHGEWIRIHPFPNGNGRTARILVNAIALRYGLPAFMRIRPRPGAEYEAAANDAMTRNWKAAVPLFTRLYESAL